MKQLIPILAWGLFLPVCLSAQQSVPATAPKASPTPPAPPLVRRVPDLTEWGITYTLNGTAAPVTVDSGREGAKQLEPLQTKSIFKGGGMILEITAKGGGASTQTWHLSGGVRMHSADGKTWIVGASSPAGFETADYTTQDFAGLSWISPQNFKGEVDYKGRKCFVFSDKVVTTEASELEAIKSHLDRSFDTVKKDENGNTTVQVGVHPQFHIEDFKKEVYAYIDVETRLPVAVMYKTPGGIVTRTYEYQKMQSMPPVPPEVRKALDSFRQSEKSLNIPHAPI
jgi:hypothetical protein